MMETNQIHSMFSFWPHSRSSWYFDTQQEKKTHTKQRQVEENEKEKFHLLTTQLLLFHVSAGRKFGTSRCLTFFPLFFYLSHTRSCKKYYKLHKKKTHSSMVIIYNT